MKKIISALLASMLVTFSSLSIAQGYVGLRVGQADSETELFTKFDTSTSFGIYGGYSVNENFSVEINYDDFGDADDQDDPKWTISSDAISIYGVLKAPFENGMTIYGKVGISMWDAELDVNNAPCCGVDNSSTDDTDFSYGFGFMLDASELVSIRIEYSAISTDDDDPTNISLGVQFNI